MKMVRLIAIASFVGVVCAHAAMAQNWQPPAEIAPKPATVAAPPVTAPEQHPSAKVVETPKIAETLKRKEAKTKDCKAQSAAKSLHGQERKKFIEECKNS